MLSAVHWWFAGSPPGASCVLWDVYNRRPALRQHPGMGVMRGGAAGLCMGVGHGPHRAGMRGEAVGSDDKTCPSLPLVLSVVACLLLPPPLGRAYLPLWLPGWRVTGGERQGTTDWPTYAVYSQGVGSEHACREWDDQPLPLWNPLASQHICDVMLLASYQLRPSGFKRYM